MLALAGTLALGTLAPAQAFAQVLEPPFDSSYSLTDIGSPPGVPSELGGLTLKAGTTDRLLIGGAANTAAGALYEVGLTRDGSGHITGFSDTATRVADAAYNDGGVTYGPGGLLFLARWPVNELGQTRPGSSITDKVIDLTPLGVASSISSLLFVPPGQPGAGSLKLASYSGGQWHDADVTPDGSGTYDIQNVTAIPGSTLPGGPEGFVYIQSGSPQFSGPSMLVSEYLAGNVAAYEVDANGDPVIATRRTFVSGLTGAEGAYIDPVTGDFVFSTFGGGSRVIVVRGFAPPSADLSLTKSDSPDPVTVGQPLTYTLTVQNAGPAGATGVTVTDTLPAGVSFQSATSGCTHASGVVTCSLGALANGASATVEITVTPPSQGTITNTASASATQTDPNTANNSASQNTTVQSGQPPTTLPGCEVEGEGEITAGNGDKSRFGIDVQSGAPPQGRVRYRDFGPALPLKLNSTEITQVETSADGAQATILGKATINGSGSFDFRIDVNDLPRAPDTFRIQLSNGYDSGEQTIRKGDVDIECKCEVEAVGRIRAANGDRATVYADVKAPPARGRVRYRDHGPTAPLKLNSTEITQVIVTADGREARVLGKATVDGGGSFDFRLDVRDILRAPDTFRIQVGNGYDSGEQTVEDGEVDIECGDHDHHRGTKRGT